MMIIGNINITTPGAAPSVFFIRMLLWVSTCESKDGNIYILSRQPRETFKTRKREMGLAAAAIMMLYCSLCSEQAARIYFGSSSSLAVNWFIIDYDWTRGEFFQCTNGIEFSHGIAQSAFHQKYIFLAHIPKRAR